MYSARHYGQEPAFDAFTKQTGIQLRVLTGDAGPLFERLKAEGDRSPADVLLTVDAGNLWNAARGGLLGPVTSATLAANVPAHLRDPENKWFGLTMRARTIMYNPKKVTPGRALDVRGARRSEVEGPPLPAAAPATSTTSRWWPP